MPVINQMRFNGVRLYWLDFKEPNKFGKLSVIIGGLTDEYCKALVGTRKVVKTDDRYGGKYINFSIAPEKINNVVFVDSANKKISYETKIPNGSIANVALCIFQNAMGTFPILSGIQVVEMAQYVGPKDAMFSAVDADESLSGLDMQVDDIDG